MTVLADQAQQLRGLVRQTAPGPAASTAAPRRHRARIVTVTSGKGGVGKTSLSVNLAIRLSVMGRRVVLLDADLGTANADVLCNLTPTDTLAHVVAGQRTLAQTMVEAPGGFRLVPGASGLAAIAALGEFERARLVDQIHELEHDADLVLIDTGAGVSPNVLSFAVAADQLLVVTTPEPTAVTDAYALIKTVSRQRDDIDVRLLVNIVREPAEGREVFGRLEAVCRRFLTITPRYAGHILYDPRVAQAVRHRRPFVLENPNSEASRCISQLAHRMDRHAREPRSEGLLGRMALWLSG
ncbi:MAG: MinD/ParA family protein [Phycisphaeraceae bacterium]